MMNARHLLPFSALPCAALLCSLLAACEAPQPPQPAFSLLQANIGTALLACDRYVFKLCDVDAEAAIAARIATDAPDVIALQEVLPDAVCDAIDADGGESDPRRPCHPTARSAEPTQLHRLIDVDAYDVRCDDRFGYECVAVARAAGAFVSDYVTAPAIVLDDDDCDAGFSVGRVDIGLGNAVVRVANGHPQSTKDTCRRAQVEQLFGALANDDDDDVDAVVVTGDMNLDPFGLGLDDDDVSVDAWRAHVHDVHDADDVDDGDSDSDFVYASGPAERATPYPTTTTALFSATLDHVAVRGAVGTCVTQGAAPDTHNLDNDAGAMDHRALACALRVRATP